jgi:hypothetical protein
MNDLNNNTKSNKIDETDNKIQIQVDQNANFLSVDKYQSTSSGAKSFSIIKKNSMCSNHKFKAINQEASSATVC